MQCFAMGKPKDEHVSRQAFEGRELHIVHPIAFQSESPSHTSCTRALSVSIRDQVVSKFLRRVVASSFVSKFGCGHSEETVMHSKMIVSVRLYQS